LERKLAAILVADVVGYSRLTGADEEGTLAALKALRMDFLEPLIAEHRGRVVKLMGDGLLVEFQSAVDAVKCAVAWQKGILERKDAVELRFRIGVNLGDIVIDGNDVLGDGVNVAARLEGLAKPGEVIVSDMVHQSVRSKLDLTFDDRGMQELKNIEQPVRVWKLAGDGASHSFKNVSHPFLERPSIAVLPFTNLSGDPEQEYFSDGLTEDIITELSRFREFMVISRNSTFQYKGQAPKAKDVGRELGVRYVVEGSVRRAGDRVRITTQLIDAETDAQIWAERFDRNLDDLFEIQDEVTASVVARLDDRVKGAGAIALRTRKRPKTTAYDLVLQSRPYRTQISRSGSRKACDLLERAIAADPDCAQAYAGLAFARASEYLEGWCSEPEATLRQAELAANRAVTLDNSDGYSHASLAYVCYVMGDIDRAVHEAQAALALNPNHVNIIMTNGWISVVAGDPEAGIEHIEYARQLNPNMPGFELWTLGEAYLDARRYQDAVDTLSKVSKPPTVTHLEMAVCYAYLGQQDKARDCLNTYLNLAEEELEEFPGEDPSAWRAFLEKTIVRRRKEDVEHFIDGAREAGLPVES
jgi:TolB-like protein/Tfp pilus assembly protein PilF